MTRARVLTFHIDSGHLPELTEALDGVAERLGQHPEFRGLLCLEHDGVRNEIVVMTLWDGEGLEATAVAAEYSRQRIAACTDLNVISRCYEVVRLVPGSVRMESLLAEALAS